MPKYTDKERQELIEEGIKAEQGEITARQMGAMGGTTVRNVFKAAGPEVLEQARVSKRNPGSGDAGHTNAPRRGARG